MGYILKKNSGKIFRKTGYLYVNGRKIRNFNQTNYF